MGTGAKIAIVGVGLVGVYFVATRMMGARYVSAAPATTASPGGVSGGSGTIDKIRQGISVAGDAWHLTQDIAGAFGADWGTKSNPNSVKSV